MQQRLRVCCRCYCLRGSADLPAADQCRAVVPVGTAAARAAPCWDSNSSVQLQLGRSQDEKQVSMYFWWQQMLSSQMQSVLCHGQSVVLQQGFTEVPQFAECCITSRLETLSMHDCASGTHKLCVATRCRRLRSYPSTTLHPRNSCTSASHCCCLCCC